MLPKEKSLPRNDHKKAVAILSYLKENDVAYLGQRNGEHYDLGSN
jgi:hypothetical protein